MERSKEQRRMEWSIEGDGVMHYSRPTTLSQHASFILNLGMRGQLPSIDRVVAEQQSASAGSNLKRTGVMPRNLSEDGAEYFFASLILEGLPEGERNARLREVGLTRFITP